MEKRCTKCGEVKSFDLFYKDKNMRDGRRSACRACYKAHAQAHPESGRARAKKYREKHPEKARASMLKWQRENPEKLKAASLRWKENNPEKVKEYTKEYYEENSEERCAKSRRYYAENKQHCIDRRTKWGKDNPMKLGRLKRNYSLKHLYGITEADYNRMILEQGECCAMCGKPLGESKKRHPVDHDHSKTGAESVRGIVHNRCNAIIGIVENESEKILLAQRYVSKSPVQGIVGL